MTATGGSMHRAKQLQVVSANGEGIGTLTGVYVTPGRETPKLAVVGLRRAGKHSRRTIPIPLTGARCEGDTLVVAFTSAQVRDLELTRMTEHTSGQRVAVHGDRVIAPDGLRRVRLRRSQAQRPERVRIEPWAHAWLETRVVRDERGLGTQELEVRRTARLPADAADDLPDDLPESKLSFVLYREVDADPGDG